MRIISWNVNGLRAILKHGFCKSVANMCPDIICLQEIKVDKTSIPEIDLPGYHKVFNPAIRKGYAGTAMFSKIQPINVNCESIFNSFTESSEGRVIISEYDKFFLVAVYTPNSGAELVRLKIRHDIWDAEMLKMLLDLKKKKPVIFCGDMNVAHEEIDLAHPEQNHFSAGFTDEERHGMTNYLKYFGVDTFRKFYPNKGKCYSWWSYRMRSRERNVGWRLDYVIVDKDIEQNVKTAFIMPAILGSDHAPVGVDIDM